MKFGIARSDAPMTTVLFSPLSRLKAVPAWEITPALGASAQLLYHDAFFGALILVFFGGIFDFVLGVRVAKLTPGVYSTVVAQRGFYGKVSGILLLLLIRALEHYLQLQGIIPNLRGMVATAVAISLFAVDLQSIAHHREEFGAQRIPILSRLFDWLQRISESLFPPDSAAKP
jgi:hypothetical protein